MNPERYFSGGQLTAYTLAQRGALEPLADLVRSRGVDLNAPGKEDLTLLGFAVLAADKNAIIFLMKAGADPNQPIPDAGTPAVMTISKHFNPPKTEAVAALIDGGYNVNQLLSGSTPFLFYFADFNHWPGLKLALDRGGNINVQSSGGESLVTYVIEGGDLLQARALIEMGAQVNLRGKRNETALRAIESHISSANPSVVKVWREMLGLRQLILSKLVDERDRTTVYSDKVNKKIAQNP